jgi:hypothetical protein
MSYDSTQSVSEAVRSRRVVVMEEVVAEDKAEAQAAAVKKMDSKVSETDQKGGVGDRVLMEIPGMGAQHFSFQGKTFAELDKQVKDCLSDKELVTITCWHDGKMHNCMLGAKVPGSNAPVESGQEVLVNGTAYRYRGQASLSKDGQMILQCY